jgi:hypothetical protein
LRGEGRCALLPNHEASQCRGARLAVAPTRPSAFNAVTVCDSASSMTLGELAALAKISVACRQCGDSRLSCDGVREAFNDAAIGELYRFPKLVRPCHALSIADSSVNDTRNN